MSKKNEENEKTDQKSGVRKTGAGRQSQKTAQERKFQKQKTRAWNVKHKKEEPGDQVINMAWEMIEKRSKNE